MTRIFRLCCVVVLFFALATPPAGAAGGAATELEQQVERRTLKYINAYRVKKGLTPLVSHLNITREARRHSNHMADEGELSHDNFDARKAKIVQADPDIDDTKICENTASAQGYQQPGPVAKRVWQGWKRVRKLRNCMLDAKFDTHSAGVGVELRGQTWYVTFIAANDSSP